MPTPSKPAPKPKLTPAVEKAHIKTIQTKFSGKSEAAILAIKKLQKLSYISLDPRLA